MSNCNAGPIGDKLIKHICFIIYGKNVLETIDFFIHFYKTEIDQLFNVQMRLNAVRLASPIDCKPLNSFV